MDFTVLCFIGIPWDLPPTPGGAGGIVLMLEFFFVQRAQQHQEGDRGALARLQTHALAVTRVLPFGTQHTTAGMRGTDYGLLLSPPLRPRGLPRHVACRTALLQTHELKQASGQRALPAAVATGSHCRALPQLKRLQQSTLPPARHASFWPVVSLTTVWMACVFCAVGHG